MRKKSRYVTFHPSLKKFKFIVDVFCNLTKLRLNFRFLSIFKNLGIMKKLLFTLVSLAIGASSAHAALSHWKTAVGTGTSATATKFTTVSTPETINVGTTAGTAMSFEFIVNAGSIPLQSGGSVLLGDYSSNEQILAWEQFTNTNNYGIFDSKGSGYLDSGVALTADTDTHLVFTTDGTNTYLYVNGALAHTFTGTAMSITGTTGLGGVMYSSNTFGSALPGNILGFAAYNSELSATEIAAHSAAFVRAVPEPSTTALLGLGGLALILRRRK